MEADLELIRDFSDLNSAKLKVLEFTQLDFVPKRIYWMFDFVEGVSRGNHAHIRLKQYFFAIRGSVVVDLFNGNEIESYSLSTNSGMLSVNPGQWRVIRNASPDAILMVIADREYDESDYIRQWDSYLAWYYKN